MLKTKNKHGIDVFFVLCVFLICAISLLGMLFVGARTQQKVNQSTEENFYMRTSLLYISNKAKFFQEKGRISVGEFNNNKALFFEEEIDGIKYVTKVYIYDGYLMELFTEKNSDLEADAGTIITNISFFEPKQIEPGLIDVQIKNPDGKSCSVIILN